MSRQVDREVFNYCKETCPAVDAAFTQLIDELQSMIPSRLLDEAGDAISQCSKTVKDEGTELLRSALRAAVQDKQDVERELEAAEREISRLEARIEELV